MNLEQLRRIRHGARAALALGVVVSIVANILHASDNLISQSIAAWAPMALLITIELIARVPVKGWLSVPRLLATATIAGIAAWVSYWHMVGVALRYGENAGSAHLIPLTVDGLVVVAWVSLVELGGRIRDAEQPTEVAQQDTSVPVPASPSAPVFLPPVSAPPAPVAVPEFGAAASDDSAGQKVRADTRSAQQVESVVRAMKTADPKLSQRKIAEAAMVPPTTVRRILQDFTAAQAVQPNKVNGRVPDLEDAPV